MQGKVNGEEPFKALKDVFCVGPTSAGYTLSYSTKKEGPWTNYDNPTPADETLLVNGVVPYMWFRLTGNGDDNVDIIL